MPRFRAFLDDVMDLIPNDYHGDLAKGVYDAMWPVKEYSPEERYLTYQEMIKNLYNNCRYIKFEEKTVERNSDRDRVVMRTYRELGLDVPVRGDHVPEMAYDRVLTPEGTPGYFTLGVSNGSLGRCMITHYQVPVRIGKVTVRPGDIIMGDIDGVICIPREITYEVLLRAEGIERNEVDIFSWVRQGDTISEIIDKGGYF